MEKKRKLLVLLLSFMMVFTTMPASIGVAFADDISSVTSVEDSENLTEVTQDLTETEDYISEPTDSGEDPSETVSVVQETAGETSEPVISEETLHEETEDPSYEEESSDPAEEYSDPEPVTEENSENVSSDKEDPADTEKDEEEEEEEQASAQYVSRNGLIAVNVQGKAAESMQLAAETLEEQGDVSPETARFLAGELFRDFNGPYTPETIPNYDRQGDGTNIEGISAQWVSTDTTEDGNPLNLYVKPEGDNRQSVMLQVDYHLSGQYDYAPGTIKITVPAYIFTKRGTGEDQPPNYGTMIIPYPEDNNNTDDFKWNLKGDHYELINVNTLSAATKGFIRFSIAGMLPHDLIDMKTSAPFSADIYVETFANSQVLGLRSNSLTAVFDTDVNLTAVEKKQSGNVQIVPKSVIPADQRVLKEDGTEEEYYVLVNWYMTASTTSNTYYSLTYTDELVKNRNNTTYNGFIVNSYSNVVSDGANGEDTVSTNAGTSSAFHGYREMNGSTSMVQTAYPYSQFKAGTYYYFKNKVTYNLVEDDTGKTVSKSSDIEIRWYYEDPKWPTPGGHFMVNKNGNDGSEKGNSVHRLTYDTYVNNDHHLWNRLNNGYYGVYATALNNLRDGEDVVLSYTLDSIGYVMPWFYDSNAAPAEDGTPATRSSSNYTRPVEITTEDTGMSIGRNMTDPEWDGPTEDMAECIPLTAGTDYNFISLEFPGSPYVYKATPNNLGPNGSVNATSYGDGTFKYVKDTTAANWPDVDIYIQTGGSSEWTKYAVFSWEDESFALTDGGTVSGVKISLPDNTTNFKTVVTLQNDPSNPANNENYAIQAGINYDVRVETKLYHDSSTIANKVAESFEESNAPQLYIFNNDKMTANRADGNKDQLVVIPRDGYNMVRGYELDTMVVPSKNGDFDETVDFYNNVATIHYSAQVEEKTLIGDLDSYNQALADGLVPKERNVIWRDLLPPGMTPDLNSIDLVRENDRLTNAYYINIKELKPEYTGPDRNILIVYATLNNEPEIYSEGDATYYQDVPQIKFEASIDLKSIQGYGYDRSRIHNVISFESLDIDNLGTVTNYQGEPDDPHANRNAATEAAFENETEKYLMTNLDPERDTNSFLYAGTYTRLLIPTAAISSLDKVVNVNNEKKWSTGIYSGNKEENQRLVYLNGTYKYRLSYSPESSDTIAKNIIFYDSLENFYAGSSNDGGIDEGAPRWQGKFAGVDTSMLETSGCDPVVWYSLEENLQIASETDPTQAHEVNTVLQGPVWIKASEYTGDLSLVKAIAVDASKSVEKDENGNALDFELEYGQSATFIINMKAPTEEEANENEYIYKKNGERVQGAFGDSAQAYNNAYVRCTNYNKTDHTAYDNTFVRKDYTKVGLFNYEVSITKAWNDDDDRDGKRPDSVVIQLCTEDGPVEGKEIELPLKDESGEFITDENGNYIWSYTFKYLPNVTPDGKTINYTFKEKGEDDDEDNDNGYSSSITSIVGTHYTLTNKHNPERTKLEGTKTWVGDTEDVRPARIWIDLYQDGTKVSSTYTDASKNWNWSFNNLYKYRDGGIPIEYTYKENFEYSHMDSYISETVGNEIINTYHPYGDLKVHKATKDTTEASKDTEFEFVFDFKHKVVDEEGHTATATLPGPFNYEILDEEGNSVSEGTILSGGTIKIKGGQTIHIIEIDEGAEYTVTEIDADGFYNTDKEGYKGTIKPNEVVEASFENTYSTRGKAYLKAIKHYENHKIDDFQFSYGVYEVKENGEEVLIRTSTAGASGSTPYEILDDGTVVYSADVSFGAFSYSLADDGKTFTYRIKEDIPSDADADLLSEGTTYDDTVYTVTVAVSDNGDGTMTCDVKYYDKNGNLIAEPGGLPVFTNKYQAEGSIELKAWKELVGRDPVNGEFTFALLDENGQPVLDENGEAITTTNVGKEIIFPAIHYTERDAGKTYKYIAVEVPGNDPNVHYDTKQIGFIVTVVDKNNGTLEPTFVYADPETWSTENVGVGKFVNTLEPGSLEVTKKISEDSTDYDENQTFTFKIKFIGDVTGITFPEGFTGWDADNKTATVSLRGNESFTIDNIPAGTTYNVTEEYLDGWIPIAQDNVSGDIITSETAKASITNQYQPDIATVQLFGTKMLDNKAAEKELFTFTLDEKANADGKIKIINASGKVVETDLPLTVKNTDGGFIQFPIIIYEEPGEHIYTIKEQIGEDDTIDYDAHEETVKVTVTKDETSGMLLANIQYTTGDVEFLNKKHPGNLRITKEGDTHSYTDDEFYFLVTLVNEDGQPLSENGTIDWYTEKTGQSKAAIFFEKAGEKISSGWDSVKTWAKGTWEDIKEVFTEPLVDTAYGAEGDIDSGTYAGISWRITSEGELILGNGSTQTLANYSSRDFSSWPWNKKEYIENGTIKSVSVSGIIIAQGSLKGMFLGHCYITDDNGNRQTIGNGHTGITSIDLSGLDTTAATDMATMFEECSKLTTLNLGDSFNTANVTNMASMFQGCKELTTLNVSNFNTANVTNMSNMFSNCERLTALNVSNFDTSNVTSMASMFFSCKGLTTLDVSNFNTANVTNMQQMFYGVGVKSLDVSNFNTANVTNMSSMFASCRNLETLNLGELNTSNVTSMTLLFGYCPKLKSLDVSSFNTSKVTSMGNMFVGCKELTTLDLSNFDTSNVTKMDQMFASCTNLTSLNISSFRTPKVTDMGGMFSSCSNLESLDVSKFDTSNVKDMNRMFSACSKLEALDVSNFNTSKVTNMKDMFSNTPALKELDLSNFDCSKLEYQIYNNGTLYGGMYDMFFRTGLTKVTLGPDFAFVPYEGDESHDPHTPVLNKPSSNSPYTGKWIRQDGLYGPYTPEELSAVYNDSNPSKSALAGVWIWEEKDGSCKVRFDANGGYTTAQTQTLKKETDTVTMPNEGTTMRPGYDLIGWNTEPDGSGTQYRIGQVVEGLFEADTTKTLYAQWERTDKLHYVVEHYQQDTDLRGYTLAEREVKKIPLEEQGTTVTPDVKDYPGFITPDTQTGTVEGDYTLTIQYYYDRTTYTIKFDANGGEGQMDDLTMLGNVSRRLPENGFTKQDSIFKGWNTEPDGTGTYYANAQRVNNLAEDGETVTLYAQWVTNQSTDLDPTTGQIIVHCKEGETIVIPNLPAGTTYTIQEINNPNGWTQTGIVGENGELIPGSNGQSNGHIDAGGDDQTTVYNAYKAKGQIVLRAMKILEGGTLEAGDYTFVLTDSEGNELGRKTCSENGTVVFDAITYEYAPGADPAVNDLGTHTYYISEVAGNDGFTNYDSHTETVTVNVTDPHISDPAQGGALEVTAAYSGGEETAVFINTKEFVDLSGTKVWEDSNNQDGIRPDQIVIHLLADGKEKDSKTVTANNGWSWTFSNLPKYDYEKQGDDKEIEYTIKEVHVDGYDTEVDGYDVINTHVPETTEVSGSKTWDDKNNQDAARPSSITINLFADGVKVDSKTVTPPEDSDVWEWSFTDLPKYNQGVEIKYTITEDPVEYYTTVVNGYDVKNTHVPETTSVWGLKRWVDGDNMDGIRPSSIVVYLFADGDQIDTKTVTAAENWRWDFSNLPKYKNGIEINYTVQEKPIAGYTSETSGHDIINTHYTAKGSVTFEGKKTLENKTLEAGAFTFLIMEGDTEIARVTNTADGTIEYPVINYTHNDIGTHTYTVTEIEGDIAGVNYSETSYTVTVEVTDTDHDGVLEVTASNNATALNFTNVYEAKGPLELSGKKILEHKTLEAGKYQFGLYNLAGGNLIDTATNDADGNFKFKQILFEQDDVGEDGTAEFIYTVKEIVPDEPNPGVTYDENTIYYVKVNIRDDGEGHILVDYKIYTDAACTQLAENGIEFTNTYAADGKLELKGTKTLTGRELTASDTFTFEVKEGDTVVSSGTAKGTAAGGNTAAISYADIEYTLEDVGPHTYTVTETSVDGNGITVATNTYTFTVTVSDNGDGTLSVTENNNGNIHENLNFTNTYNATGSVTFEGEKSILNRDMTEDDIFTFEVTEEGADHTWVVRNDANGKINYPTITYTLDDVGEHTYKVRETSQSTENLTTDSKEYTVTVTITDDGQGHLIVTKTAESDDYTALNFTNVYNAGGSITFAGTKTIDSRKIKEGETFSFRIVEKIEGEEDKLIANVQSDSTGKIEYPTIEYTLSDVGTHTYVITETSTNGSGITVDTKSYTVIIEVKDDGQGHLTATKTEASADPIHLDFVNKYKAEGAITLAGTKKLAGRDITSDDEFTFEIREGNTVVATGTSKGGTITFTEIGYLLDATHNDVGDHTYTIVETSTDGDGITVDKNSVTVVVTVKDNGNGTLSATTAEGTEITFNNLYNADGSVTFAGTKTIDGRDLTAADVFSFSVTENGTDKTWNVTNSAPDGKINYPTISYTLDDVGEHTYTVTETTVGSNGITADTNTYTVTVTVTDNGNGTLNVVTSTNAKALNFENKYAAAGEYKPAGTKTLTGRTLTANDKFSFEVKEGDKVVSTGTNNAAGKIDFSAINYTLADVGKHSYTVTEVKGELGGVDYSTESYTVTVTVSDNGNGTLNVVTSDNAKALNFTNEYSATGEYKPEGTKTLTGRKLTANDKFTFEVKEGEKVVSTGTNDETGKIDFTKINYTLDDVGTHTYTVTETSTDGKGITVATNNYTVTVTITDNGNGTLKVETSTNANALNFENTYTATGKLELDGTKTLTGRALKATDTFTFEVKEGTAVVSSGTAQGTAAGGNTAAISYADIEYTLEDVGTHTYTVTETSVSENGITVATNTYTFTVTVADNGDGSLSVTENDNGRVHEKLDFTNVYDAEGEITFEGTKRLDGRAPTDSDVFTFEIKEGNTVIGEGRSDKSGKITYPTIKYGLDDLGEHTYTITESTENGNGITIDTRTYTVVVNVTDDGNGHLTATPTSGNIHTLNFTNTYTATGSITFEGTKRISGRDMTAKDKFKFTLYDEDGKAIETVENGADGKIVFSTINYTLRDVGTHTYTVKETSEGADGIIVDNKTYTIVVTVTDGGNGELIITTDNGLEKSLAFVNVYEAEGEITFEGTKSIDGRDLLETDEFSFTLYDQNGKALETVHQDENGDFAFTTLEYDEKDVGKTYTYTVKETSTDGKGITVDKTEYTITVTVSDKGDGTLQITTNTDEVDPHHLDFQNRYAATGEYKPEGTKSIDGRALTANDKFTFEVKEGDKVVSTGTNDATGKIDFTKIEYTLDDVGTHTYLVTETSANGNGITVDTNYYTVTVTVTDNGDGTLNVATSANAKALDFENKYAAEGSTTFEGTKTIDGRAMTEADVFSFQIAENGTDKIWNNVTNSAPDGKINYPTINYTLADVGEHTYTVTETSVDGNGITKDSREYTVTVTVTDNGNGTLNVVTSTNAKALNFENKYAAAGEYKPAGTKTLTGRTLTANDKFTFVVKEGDKVVSTGTNDVTGKIDFSTISYTLADVGEHTYTVTEVKGELGGVGYSTASYTVTVTVSDKGDGTLNVVTSENAKALNFENTYTATGEYKPEGTKTLTGRALTANDKFTFEVKEGDKVVSTGTNDATGKIDFSTISYTLADVGTHTYTVTETSEDGNGITVATNSYTVTVTVSDNGNGTLNVATSTNAKALNFENKYAAEGEYKPEGTKTLTGRKLTANDKFAFEVKEGEKVVSTGTSDETGKIDFTKINYTLADVGEHTYTVNEVKGELGGVDYSTASYTVTVTVTDNGDGTLNVATSSNAKALNFENTYTATGEYKPEGTKTLTGRTLTANDEFTFEVKEGEKVVSTGTSDEIGKIDFSTINYTLADVGEHTYTVTEVKGELGGVDYSTASYTVTVNVTDNGNGTLNVATSTNAKALNFTNTYSATGSVLFEGTKRITGRAMNEKDIFTFEVREGEELIQTVTNGADGKINFESIAYTLEDVGTHTYTVTETSVDGDGITVDTNVYTVTVTVSDKGDGTLNVVTSENAKTLTFVNTYAADGEITFSGIKSIDGRELKPEDKFEFTLFDSEGEEIEKVTNDEDGYYSFTALEYDLDDLGTHEYTVKETSEGGSGITVDTTEYKITVNVEDGGKGKLVVTSKTDKEGTDVSRLNFTNKYEATGSVQLEASKSLLGRVLREAEFEFELYKDGQLISKANNANDGKIVFDKIDYDLSDAGKSYVYTVREVAGDVPGVTYDNREFKITVTITDNGDGTLKAEVTTDKEVVFVNPYNAEGKLVLEGKKTLEGDKLKGDDFEFTVSENGKVIQTVKNDAKGKIAFEEICYTIDDVGTHTYTVKEKAGNQRGMYYDQTEYTIKVKVSDNGDGTLKVSVLDGSDDIKGLNFKNTYEPPANPPVTPKTGDGTNVTGYALAFAVSLLALMILLRRKRTDR